MAHNWETELGMQFQRDEGRKSPVLSLCFDDPVPYLTFPKLAACEKVRHLFTTRAGGVSKGQFTSMNFSVHLGDDKSNVRENYERIAKVLGCDVTSIVGTVQTHTTNIRRVDQSDAGKVVVKEPDYGDIDGLVTNEKGLVLAVYTADCVPLFFVDPVREAIGMAHSGWRGTTGNMAGKMVERMAREFGTDPKDLLVAIGPSICQKCYEVDETVAEAFRNALGDELKEREMIRESGIYPMQGSTGLRQVLEPGKAPGKYQLDLWLANLIWFIRAGVLPEHIDVTDLCTAQNKDLLFSHRASAGKRGNMAGFLMLKEGE